MRRLITLVAAMSLFLIVVGANNEGAPAQEPEVFAESPVGTIIAWYATSAAIPDGWAICDGDRGTPNLKDRFLIGSPSYLIEELHQYEETLGVNYMIFRIQWPGLPHAQVMEELELLGRHVIPALRS